MNWYKQSAQTTPKDTLDDFFNLDEYKGRKEISRDQPAYRSITLTLYRGFNVDINSLKREGESYILSPKKSEQGLMWFTHSLIRGYDPKAYVQGRGSHLLTYPLQCKKYYQTVHYSDGSSYEEIPEEIQNQSDPLENCRFYVGYELPEGWFFSYKMEKFIVCDHQIKVLPSMITENQTIEEE